jgi:alpha-1,3-rhamnosyl/mannosyltransferase
MNCLSSVSGGAVSYLRNLSPLLANRFAVTQGEHEVFFLAHESQRGLLAGLPDRQCCFIRGARPAGWRRVLWERRNIDRITGETGSDVLFTNYQIATPIKGAKQVLVLHNIEPFLFGQYRYSLKTSLRNAILARASARSLRAADRVIAVSGFARDRLLDRLDVAHDRIRTIYHGGPAAAWEKNGEADDRSALARLGIGERFVLTAGSLLPYRRSEDVIAAFDRCAEDLAEGMQLVIAGSGADKRYGELVRQAIDASPYRERILPLGHVPWHIMKTLYRYCDLCVLATEIEACPNIAIEAMTAGCVIVSCDKPPLPEMFAGSSISYRARDIGDMVEQMRSGLQDSDLREGMKRKARDRARFFSWEKCADETYAVLTDWS